MEFWYRRRGYGGAQKQRVRIPQTRKSRRDDEALVALIEHSESRWGRPVVAVEAEIEQRVQRLLDHHFDDFDPVGEHGY